MGYQPDYVPVNPGQTDAFVLMSAQGFHGSRSPHPGGLNTKILTVWAVASLAGVTGSIEPLASAADAIETAGNVLVIVLPVGAGGMTLGLGDWQGSLQLGESEGVTLATTTILKYSLDTRRPNGGHLSFPSEHASVSFSAAEFLRKRYGWEFGVPAYAAASFVAYSRVESGQHYYYDVMGGAAIGIISSYIFTRPWKGWEVKTEAGPGLHGLFFTHRW